jgi:ElaB/YqjD/DUF883 family membrane-anchored ribosome-binding protein
MADHSKTADEVRSNGAGSDDERRIRELARRAEEAVRERAAQFKERAQAYYDDASEHIETAQRYITERVQERPLTTTLAALGVGFVLGVILAGGRRR